VHVHPVLPWNLKSQQPQLPRSEPDGQPTESSHLGNVREAVIPNGRMSAAGSDAYQKVLLQTGHLKDTVAFDAVFTNRYLPA
jgi:hypothetical protein